MNPSRGLAEDYLRRRLLSNAEEEKSARRSGAKEHRLPAEDGGGDAERQGGVDAGREEDQADVVPLVVAGEDLFRDQADVEDGHERQLRVQLNPRQDSHNR